MAELARVHLVVELVLGRAEVAQVLGHLRPLGDKDVLLLATSTLDHKFTPLQEQKKQNVTMLFPFTGLLFVVARGTAHKTFRKWSAKVIGS